MVSAARTRQPCGSLSSPQLLPLNPRRRQCGLRLGPERGSSAAAAARPKRQAVCCRAQAGDGSQGPPGQSQQAVQQQALDPDVWASKPAWCQPWTILGTGGAFVAGVWMVSGGSTGWTVAGALPVAAWWFLFLGIMPAQYREYAEAVNGQQRQLLELQRRQQEQQQRRREE